MATKARGAEQAPNIKLREGATPLTVSGEVNIGMAEPIILPTLAEQKKGFYLERAAEILALAPDRYVPFVALGGEAK